MNAVTHLEKVITGEVSAVTHLEKVIAGETSAVTYTEKVITGEAPPITHLQKVIAGEASPVTHLEHIWAGGSPTPTEHEYTGAVPVTFTADGTPLLGFLISGNMSQSGTPTSTTPIQPSECGERTGNLFDKNATDTNNGYVVDGYLTSGGTINTNNDYRTSEYIPILSNQKYITYAAGLNVPSVCFYDANKNYISGVHYAGRQYAVFTTPSDAKYVRLSFKKVDKTIMFLNLGDTALSYEPYGYKIPILSADTTTPIYLGEVQTTRKIRKLVLTGGDDENWNITNNTKVLYLAVSGFLKEQGTICYCTHYETVNNVSSTDDVNDGECTFNDHLNWLYIKDSNYTSTQGFKNYLAAQYAAGTPVTVWYVLAEPTTGIVNEPLRKIGDYADTLSMEQAGVSIPTNNGSTTVDVDTTVKPSEVYIKYKG